MALQFHPEQGSIVTVNFEPGFIAPEMVKRRPCVVLSLAIKGRPKLLTVVALSTTPPPVVLPFHAEIEIPFDLPDRWAQKCWVKGDMVNTVGFHRTDLLRLGKGRDGQRIYQTRPLPAAVLTIVQGCVLRAIGL